MRSPGARVALTLLLPLLVVVAGERVLLPGMADLLGTMARRSGDFFASSRSNVSVLALGVTPVVTAYGLVEITAFLVPRWSRLRHGNPEGRRKLERAARIVAIVLAAFQAWGVAQSIAQLGSTPLLEADLPSPWLNVATLIGGVCFQIVVAEIISRQGIANGYVLLSVVGSLVDLRGSLAGQLQKATFLGALDAKTVVLLVLTMALPAVATWLALRGSARAYVQDTTTEGAGPYRAARALAVSPWVPVPSSSLAPYPIATSLIMLPTTLLFALGGSRSAKDLTELLSQPVPFTILLVTLTAIIALVLARVLHSPREMADVASRLGFEGGEQAAAKARAALSVTFAPTLLFFAVLLLASTANAALPVRLSAMFVPLLVALVMDVALSLRTTSLVPVWQEGRASAVPVVRAVLEAEGIDATVRGINVLSLLQAFAPYAPAQILVPEADAARATAILRHVFLGEDRPEADGRAAAVATRTADAWTPSRRTMALGVTAAAALALVALAKVRTAPSGSAAAPRHEIEVVRVDDTSEVFEKIPEASIPEGIDLRWESAPVGPGRTQRVYFAQTPMRAGERYEAAAARLREWCKTIALPEGRRIGLQAVEDYDPDSGKSTRTGVRTFVLTGPPVIRTDDVVEAAASVSDTSGMPEPYVAITLSPEAGERFRVVTGESVQRRIAILVDGEISSAPVVRSEIGGGRLSITMGAGDRDRQLEQAKALANGLDRR
jgi:preprotein translocase subunit SecY